MSHPFGSSFESLGQALGPVMDAIHQDEYQQLNEMLAAPEGRLISLRAPRAGFGKTTLLARLRDSMRDELLFIPVPLAEGRRFEGELLLEEALNRLLEPVGNGGAVTLLDHFARRLFAKGLLPMVRSGQVPCHDQEAAITSLETRPVEAFDFHHEGAVIAHWAQQQYRLLGPRLSSALSKASQTPGRHTSIWLKVLFEYSTQIPGDPARTELLIQTLFGPQGLLRTGGTYLEYAGSFINLVSYVQPVVLVLDEVEGLSGDPDAALSVASHLASFWQSAPASKCILSINDDIWNSAFVPKLPNGLRDRLDDSVIRLKSLTRPQAEELVVTRSAGQSEKVMPRLKLAEGELYPRLVLKLAREAWSGAGVTTAPDKEPESPITDLPVVMPPAGLPEASVYPPKSVARVKVPVKGQPPIYCVKASYPPAKVAPVKIPRVKAPPTYAFAPAYPPKVKPLIPPVLKSPPVYRYDLGGVPTPSPIQGAGFVDDFVSPGSLEGGFAELPKKENVLRYPPTTTVPGIKVPVLKAPPKYVLKEERGAIESPFVLASSPKGNPVTAQKVMQPPQPKLDVPFAEL